ncbi:P-loop containing nucleoside triphosphate hydrolase protein [Rickenella mellea]|uniref:DNA 3'-5' helicase n=1 Tax=Rickenella mellea TaxID=50990 RepID=A0A4Y7QCB3_9AGAM|nr:P-loop containing nucleoside triphosphate hydrolase protein [Rickenella mellea]
MELESFQQLITDLEFDEDDMNEDHRSSHSMQGHYDEVYDVPSFDADGVECGEPHYRPDVFSNSAPDPRGDCSYPNDPITGLQPGYYGYHDTIEAYQSSDTPYDDIESPTPSQRRGLPLRASSYVTSLNVPTGHFRDAYSHDAYMHNAPESHSRNAMSSGQIALISDGRRMEGVQRHPGLRLRPVSDLPDIYRATFKFGVFNAIQSSCFDTVMRTKDNMVVSAPTGSGKTVLFELALIDMLITASKTNSNTKCVYMAPTKALCSERHKDWTAKFEPMGIKCCEMTGDTAQFGKDAWGDAKNATIIITTGEKWDSLTRNWQNHGDVLSQIKLFMVDEVHILNEPRGSTVEVVISRMKTRGLSIRFVLVSATVPNIYDIAHWVGRSPSKNDSGGQQPAVVMGFGDEFRPCKLSRFVYGFARKNQNDFQFSRTLDYKIFGVLQEHSAGKPVLIFCSTRKGVLVTAEQLLKDHDDATNAKQSLPWTAPKKAPEHFHDQRLQKLASFGIGVHHAGLTLDDRWKTESMFLAGTLRVLVATSTLAVGVNLPAHIVVIKGVKLFQNNAWQEYSDLDIIQMMGRAGRPQFDQEGVSLILCESELESKYKNLAQGKTMLESSLHQNLAEHINSEIVLGTISNIATARTWIRNSFLCQRMQRNPDHYSLGSSDKSWETKLDDMVEDCVTKLTATKLISYGREEDGTTSSTEYGDIMSKYYIRQSTMALILQMPKQVGMREILETISNADEMSEVRLRAGDKQVYNKLRDHQDIRFKTRKIEKSGDKVFYLIQAVLGGISLSSAEYKTADSQPHLDALSVFRHTSRIGRVVVEVAIAKKNGSQLKHGLELLRCLTAKAWEDRPVVLKQLDSIGEKSLKVLAENGISSLQILARQNPMRLEMLLNRKPPFGYDLISHVQDFPQYKLSITQDDLTSDGGRNPVIAELTIQCSLLEQTGFKSGKKPRSRSLGMTNILTVTSEYEFIDFRRIATKALKESKSYSVTAELTKPSQSVCVYISSDTIAGLTVTEVYKPVMDWKEYPTRNTRPLNAIDADLEGFEDDPTFWDVEDDIDGKESSLNNSGSREGDKSPKRKSTINQNGRKQPEEASTASKLPNGNYACNHPCKDKTKCRHLCCREGTSKPPPSSKPLDTQKHVDPEEPHSQHTNARPAQSSKRVVKPEDTRKLKSKQTDRRMENLESLHKRTEVPSSLQLPKGQRVKLPKFSPPELARKKIPDFSLQYSESITKAEDGPISAADDDDELPDDASALLRSIRSSKSRDTLATSETDYSNPELNAIIGNATLQELSLAPQETGVAAHDQHNDNDLKRRRNDENDSNYLGESPRRRKRGRQEPITKTEKTDRGADKRFNSLPDDENSTLQNKNRDSHGPLFLPSHSSPPTERKINPSHNSYSPVLMEVEQHRNDSDVDISFTLDDTLFDMLPASQTDQKISPANNLLSAEHQMTAAAVPSFEAKDTTHTDAEDIEEDIIDQLAEFEEWFNSGAVKFLEE